MEYIKVEECELKKACSIEDYRSIEALAKVIWEEHYSAILKKEQIEYMIGKFQSVQAMEEQVNQKGYEYYKVYCKDSFAGYFAIQREEHSLFLSKVYIHKDYRGHGLGRVVFSFIEEICKESKLEKIWLTVNRFNEDSIQFYEKRGFTKVRTQIADIGSGFVMDDYIMEKVFR